jgi:hypothetical protein
LLAKKLNKNEIKILNSINSPRFYDLFRNEIISRGLNGTIKYDEINTFPKEIEILCGCCQNKKKCDHLHKIQPTCNFSTNSELLDKILSLLFFPKKLLNSENNHSQVKDQVKALMNIISPYLAQMHLTQCIPLQVLFDTIIFGKEPSLYCLYLYWKNGGVLQKFGENLWNLEKSSVECSTKWQEYYDPYLEFEKC